MSIELKTRRPAPVALTGALGLALLLAGCGGGAPAKTDAKVEPLDDAGKAAFKAQMEAANSEEQAHQAKEDAASPAKAGGGVDDEERKVRKK